jgi:hypothetical protein
MSRSSLKLVDTSASSGSSRTMPFRQSRQTITEVVTTWHTEVIRQLEELRRLEPGWDGYKGLPVSLENAWFALRMLEATCRVNTPSPQIVPGASGDLQMEWHTVHGDVELLVRGPNSVRAWYCVAGTETDGVEVELTNDFTTVAEWVKAVTEPAIAARVAA